MEFSTYAFSAYLNHKACCHVVLFCERNKLLSPNQNEWIEHNTDCVIFLYMFATKNNITSGK